MRLLLDSCVWGKAQAELVAAGHDVVWVGDWPADPGDLAILERACDEDRVVVTLDRDFGELAVARGVPRRGIIRLVNFSARSQAAACIELLERYGKELAVGGIVTAQPGHARVRTADSEEP
jgi:predicted nuclease of predicted toxin-antitoxin system